MAGEHSALYLGQDLHPRPFDCRILSPCHCLSCIVNIPICPESAHFQSGRGICTCDAILSPRNLAGDHRESLHEDHEESDSATL